MKEEDTKMLGAKVPSSIYWKFKEIAANRGERMEEAILNAALLYVDLTPSEKLATGGDKK
jgi:hypothetical protein